MSTKLKLPSGIDYGIGNNGERICRGACMGRRDTMPDDPCQTIKLRVEKLRWVDGDYDQEGAYWGYTRGTAIYCAWDPHSGVKLFTRATSRYDAQHDFLEKVPGARFYR